jgi:hypothetical protein
MLKLNYKKSNIGLFDSSISLLYIVNTPMRDLKLNFVTERGEGVYNYMMLHDSVHKIE